MVLEYFNLLQIKNNRLGLIELDSSLDIETVTEIFIRVNSAGVALSQADFAMSKIAVNELYLYCLCYLEKNYAKKSQESC